MVNDLGNLFSVLVQLFLVVLLLVLEVLLLNAFIFWGILLGLLIDLVLLELCNIHHVFVALRLFHSLNESVLFNLNSGLDLADVITFNVLSHLLDNCWIVFLEDPPVLLSDKVATYSLEALVQEQGLLVKNTVISANDHL